MAHEYRDLFTPIGARGRLLRSDRAAVVVKPGRDGDMIGDPETALR